MRQTLTGVTEAADVEEVTSLWSCVGSVRLHGSNADQLLGIGDASFGWSF